MVGALIAALDNPLDLLALLVLAVLIFGKQLPEVARSVGKGIRELRESVDLGEMRDALHGVNEVRSAVSPAAMARSALSGMGEPPVGTAAPGEPVSTLEPAAESAGDASAGPDPALAPTREQNPLPPSEAG